MNEVGRYIQVHLTGAAAGIDLFHLSGRRITDPAIRETVKLIHTELVDERRRLVRMAEAHRTVSARALAPEDATGRAGQSPVSSGMGVN